MHFLHYLHFITFDSSERNTVHSYFYLVYEGHFDFVTYFKESIIVHVFTRIRGISKNKKKKITKLVVIHLFLIH